MSITRSISPRRTSPGQSNGHGPSRRNAHERAWTSTRDMEIASLKTHIQQLQLQIDRLEAEREQLSWLFEAVPVGYVLIDENGRIREFNRQLVKMFGFRQGVLSHGPFSRLVSQSDLPKFLGHLRRCKGAREIVSTEFRIRNGKLHGVPIEMISVPSRVPEKTPALYRTAVIDLSKRHATEQRLQDTVESFGTLLDTVEGVVWEVDGETLEVTFVSRFAEKMLGYPLADWMRRGFWERHIYVDDRERVMQEISRALRERTHITIDYRVLAADRTLLWIHDRIGFRLQNGKPRLLGIAVDVTEQRH